MPHCLAYKSSTESNCESFHTRYLFYHLTTNNKMPFTAAALTLFFTDADYLNLSGRTRQAMSAEGIVRPDDLAEFDKDGLEAIFRNLRKPAKTPNTQARINAGGPALLDVEPFVVPAKSQMRIFASALGAKYYASVGRELDIDNMKYDVIERFHEEYKAIVERKKKDLPSAPKLSKGFAIHKWLESFTNHINQVVGVRNAPLSYVIREYSAVAVVPPALEPGEPYAAVYGSIEGEMIARLSHRHALYKSDNGHVFDLIESALRGTPTSASIAQFRKSRDGHAAYMAVVTQHAGKDVWDKLHKDAEETLQSRKWNGMTNVTLSQHMSKHRQAYITLSECAEHIPVELPSGRSRVTYLMDSFSSQDPGLLAALAAVRQDEIDKRVNFESAFAYLLPVCPVAIKLAKKGRMQHADVGAATAGGLGGGNAKPGLGKSGVPLRYHKHTEFKKLSPDQQTELREWNAANREKGGMKRGRGGSPSERGGAKKLKGMISALKKEQDEKMQAMSDANTASLAAFSATAASTIPTSQVARVSIGSIAGVMGDSPEKLMKTAEVAALKLQGILRGSDKKKSH